MNKTFTWDMLYRCNLRCDYCFCSKAGWKNLEESQGALRPPDQIEKAWAGVFSLFGSCRVYITGGEPFLYPGFVDAVCGMSRYHALHVTTNLTMPVSDFIRRVPADKVELNCTFHPQYVSAVDFVSRLTELRDGGVSCGVCYLAHPQQMREIPCYMAFFRKHGFKMALSIFWGGYDGKEYPSAYSPEQREFIEYTQCHGTAARMPDVEQCGSGKDFVRMRAPGSLCRAGSTYAMIDPRGNVYRCGQERSAVLGNIYDNNVRLMDGENACGRAACMQMESGYAEADDDG
ncbi:MAG: radical SAM protein [Elusimicrobia bacterium]|nr:radical SAM protein [Elusimicrobiota bacterium]